MQLIFFHYHSLPGGVTAVIRNMGEALESHSSPTPAIRVVTGSAENTEELASRWPVEVVPEIGYLSRTRLTATAPDDVTNDAAEEAAGPIGQVSGGDIAAAAGTRSTRLARLLWERWGGADAVWWVHNHHLGKNPVFTRALYLVAHRHPEQRIVLHIHDFPECGRYANLRYLRQAGVSALYPQLSNLRYVTINSRDRRILQDAGLSHVTYLPNPVAARKSTGENDSAPGSGAGPAAAAVRMRLQAAFGTEFPFFDPDAPLLLYPVRSIRRKNVFEAALLARLMDPHAALVVTLPGVSQAERQYSSMVQHAFVDGTVTGLWGIGQHLTEAGIGFDELQAAADAIVSSSVQEGFGFQFMTPLLFGKPMIGRYLDILEDVLPLYGTHPHHFYRELRVPLGSPSLSGPQALLRFRYTERLDRLAAHLPEDAVERLHAGVDEMLAGETIEFSFLLPHMQYTYLKDMRESPEFRDEVASLNAELAHALPRVLAGEARPATEAIDARFGPAAHAEGIRRILESFADGAAAGRAAAGRAAADDTPADYDAHVLRSFATLDYQRLLYE